MATLREVRKRIKSAKNIQQITKAMKMVAAAKLKKAQDRIFSARPYAEKIEEVIDELIRKAQKEKYPILQENKETTKEAILLITSDKGLCGSFNSNLIKETLNIMKENKNLSFYLIGKKGLNSLKKYNMEIEGYKFNDKNLSWVDVEEISNTMINNFLNKKYRKVIMIYSEFQTSLQQKVVKKQILPVSFSLSEENIARKSKEFLYEPTEEVVLNELLLRYIKTQVFRAILESQTSEHGVRMVAMDMATKNAGEMIRDLTLLANKTRQAAITKEILEVVSGAEALK